MTTLKTYHADEIASAMNTQLSDQNFMGLYKKAELGAVNPLGEGAPDPTLKAEIDAVLQAYRGGQKDKQTAKNDLIAIRNKVNELPEGREPTLKYLDDAEKKIELAMAPLKADDEQCVHDESETCPKCADSGSMAVALDFTIRHMVKLADALDKTGFAEIANLLDETLNKLASQRPLVVEAAKKHRGRSYKEWVKFFNKKSKEAGEKFNKTFKGALEFAKKEKGLKADKAEEYAMRTALDKMPKSYFKEPGPEHGPGKSGPLTTKKSK